MRKKSVSPLSKAMLTLVLLCLSVCPMPAIDSASAQEREPAPAAPTAVDDADDLEGGEPEMNRMPESAGPSKRPAHPTPDAAEGGSPERERRHGRPRGGRGDRSMRGGHKMASYLEVADKFVSALSDSHRAIGLAALGIRDGYRKQGRAADALPVFEELLAATKDQTDRNIYLFLIRQTYHEAKDMQKFIEINRQIIKENSAK